MRAELSRRGLEWIENRTLRDFYRSIHAQSSRAYEFLATAVAKNSVLGDARRQQPTRMIWIFINIASVDLIRHRRVAAFGVHGVDGF